MGFWDPHPMGISVAAAVNILLLGGLMPLFCRWGLSALERRCLAWAPVGKCWPSPMDYWAVGICCEMAHSCRENSCLAEGNPVIYLPHLPANASFCSVTFLLWPDNILLHMKSASINLHDCAFWMESFAFSLNGMGMGWNHMWEGVYGVVGRAFMGACENSSF